MNKTIMLRGAYNIARLGGDAVRSRAPAGVPEPDRVGQERALGAALLGHSDPLDAWDLRGEVRRKLGGYRSQDRARRGEEAARDEAPDEDGTIQRLLGCRLSCYYCGCTMKVLYAKARDPAQWTLDRIDNARPHTVANTVLACMACNLRRRRQSAEAFKDVKQMRIVRAGIAEDPEAPSVDPMHAKSDME